MPCFPDTGRISILFTHCTKLSHPSEKLPDLAVGRNVRCTIFRQFLKHGAVGIGDNPHFATSA
jgi:hypothetical protein